MKESILKYAEGMNCSQTIIKWLNDKVLDEFNQGEVEHIIDYLVAKNPRLERATYEQMKVNSEKWLKTQIKKGNDIKETKKDVEVVLDFKDGFKIVKLIGENAYKREGYLMSHCVAGYYGKNDNIYSLRDKENMPHATMSESSQQIKGKGNGCINPKYIKYVVEFLEYLKVEVRDSEMLNLGYINVEKFKKDLGKETIKNLFQKKYHYKDNKMIGKDGKEFSSFDLLDQIPLVSETQTGLKINFELKSFIKVSFDCLWKKTKKILSGNYAKNASSGDCATNASSGNCATNASSGDYAKNASSGDCATNASSGYCATNASSGDCATNASSGNCATNASSGNCAKNASSGNYATNASSGDYAKNASSGNCAKNAMEGLYSISVDAGHGGKAKGKTGCWFCLSEWLRDKDNIWKPLHCEAFYIDGKKIKEDTWYKLENKKLVEVK